MGRADSVAIDSPKNARVVAARALHSARGRRAAGAFLAEGPNAVAAAVSAGFTVREVFATDEAADRERELFRALATREVTLHTVTDRALRAVAETVTPQGVIAVVASPLTATLPEAPTLIALLEQCSDPGNAGAVIRTSDAVGADAVVLGRGSVDVWSGKCVRASAGSVFNIPVVTSLTAAEAVTVVRDRGCQILATAADGEVDLDDLGQYDRLLAPTAWLFGSEANGLSPELTEFVDAVVRIPIRGAAESFNLAAAAAICLYSSASAQRRNQP